uniref:Uncharacterized protein n=1 Tax=Haemonchus contortus TaxID=6289 RepID=A0A7I4YPJ7_HAECO
FSSCGITFQRATKSPSSRTLDLEDIDCISLNDGDFRQSCFERIKL